MPERYYARRYGSVIHGVGLCDEWPRIGYADQAAQSHEGVLEPGMTLCVESYVGAEDGVEGVKLEEQILITDTGVARLSTFPYEDCLLD